MPIFPWMSVVVTIHQGTTWCSVQGTLRVFFLSKLTDEYFEWCTLVYRGM